MKSICLNLIFLFCSILCASDVRLKNDFTKNAEGWSSPKYWNGVLTHQQGAMLLKAENKNGKNFGRCSKMVLSDRHLSGSIFSLDIEASGKGKFKVGAMIFPYPPEKPYLKFYNEAVLTSQKKQFNFKIDLSKLRAERIAVVLECGSNAVMKFDNILLKKLPVIAQNSAASVTFDAKEFKNNTILKNNSVVIVKGIKQISADSALQMDGKTTEIVLSNIPAIDMPKGFTVDLICRKGAPAGSSVGELNYDGLFQFPGSFVLARYGRCFYFLVHDGRKYKKAFLSNAIFPEKTDKNVHHIAMTCKYHEAVDQGEIWTEVQIYLDGKVVVNQKLPKIKLPHGGTNMEFATSSAFGKIWNFGGDFYGGGIFNRILTENEIRSRTLQYKNIVKPDFPIPVELTAEQKSVLKAAKLAPEHHSACVNLCKSGFNKWEEVIKNKDKYLRSFGKKICLTILDMPDNARVLSLYDTVNKRELLNWNNAFFKLHFVRGNEKKTLTMNDLKNQLSLNKNTKGVVEFSISHTRKDFPALNGKSNWRFNGKRVEFSLEINSDTYATLLDKVTFPSFNIAPLDAEKTALVVPEAGGLLYRNAVKNKVTYTGIYPRMMTSMQCGAVYDNLGGVYFSPADPLGRVKNYSYRIDSDGTAVDIDSEVAYESLKKKNSFVSGCYAALEAFEGDWYDVGLIYRKELADNNALWWCKTLPATDTPAWFRNNTLDLLMFHLPDLDMAIKLREYLELPFTIQHWYWWERGAGHHLCPLPRANTEYIEYAKLMKKHGIRILNYTNGRLWSTKDCRGEGTLFKTDGLAGAVLKKDGSAQMEPYGAPCAVLCPDTDIYRKYMFDMVTRLTAQGISGCFIDQLGAARAILCYSDKHGHKIKDDKSWNVNGHRKAFIPIRKYWRDNSIDAIMTTEDNSEHCVGLVDGLTPWRWMHDHQIPLHAMVYSGRTQYISRDPTGEDKKAPFVKAAVQVAQGEQIGHFGIVQLCSPSRGIFRRYLKRLMFLRYAVIDVFNCGMMQREIKFAEPMPKIYTKWGNHGTKNVGTLPVIVSSWKYNDCTVLILINTTEMPQKNRIVNEPANLLKIFNSSSVSGKAGDFELEPYGCELRIYGDSQNAVDLNKIAEYFKKIQNTYSETDPFGMDRMQFADTEIFDAEKWQQSAASPIVLGARVNKDLMVLDNVFYGIFYAGTGDFKQSSKGVFEVELSAPSYSGGGNIEIYLEHPDRGRKVGYMVLDRQNVLTTSWNDYRKYRIESIGEIGGKHKIFFKLNGGSVCNFRNWRWIPEGKK